MPTPEESSAALAILIDADNANSAIIKGLIDEVAKFGRATVRRIYGDWTAPEGIGQAGLWLRREENAASVRRGL
jgi:hypothetical protein